MIWHKLITPPSATGEGLAREIRIGELDGRKLAKKVEHSDAIMTGILVTRFKKGHINVENLEQMAADASRVERCSATKKVLEAIEDSA